LSDFARFYGIQLVVISVIMMVSLVAALVLRHDGWWSRGLEPASTCLAVGSVLAIVTGTLTRRGNARSSGKVQLKPLHTLLSYRYDHSDLLFYLIGNIALFVPLGFFLYLALRRRFAAVVVICGLVSVGVETLQLPIWSRSSDIDDVLTNTVGGFAGALAAVVVLRLIRNRRPQQPQGPSAPRSHPPHSPGSHQQGWHQQGSHHRESRQRESRPAVRTTPPSSYAAGFRAS
jgi:VanZ like protein